MGKNELIGYVTSSFDPDAKCGFCRTKENLVQWETPSKMKGIPITVIQYTCRSCAKKHGMTIPEEKCESCGHIIEIHMMAGCEHPGCKCNMPG